MKPLSSISRSTSLVYLLVLITASCSCGAAAGEQYSGEAEFSADGDSTKISKNDSVHIAEPVVSVAVDTTLTGLIVYYPNFTSIDLVCGTVPSMDDKRVIMFCEAAFTNELLNEFTHTNIQCSHASSGEFYDNGVWGRNNGAFVYYDGNWKFFHNGGGKSSLLNAAIDTAAVHGGMGFCQEMFIHDNIEVQHTRPDHSRNLFRALCCIDGNLCIADASQIGTFREFINNLLTAGVTDALYLDMGGGWNYSWYRPTEGAAPVIIHPKTHDYITNWITFYHY